MGKSMATKLPQHLVDEIREAYALGGISQARIAVRFDVSETTIFRVVNHLGAYVRATIDRPREPMPPELEAEALAAVQNAMKLQEELNAKKAAGEYSGTVEYANKYGARKKPE